MEALILVGGEGTRLRPLTYEIPKPMLPIVEGPIIARIVEWLARFGVTKAVLSLGYRPDAFLSAFPDGHIAGVELAYAVEPQPLDTGGAIRFAAERAGLGSEAIIVINGDVLTDLNLDELIEFHHHTAAEATIALTPVEDPSAFGVVPTTSAGRVLAFIEKPPIDQAPTNLINAGTYILEPAVLAAIDAGRRVSIEREVFPSLVEKGVLYAHASDAYWLDTGTPDRFLQAQFDVLEGRRPEVIIPPSRETQPGVRIAQSATIEGSCTGNSFVAGGAYLHARATAHDAVIGADVVVGAGATIDRSVVLAGARIAPGARVSGSIIGPNAVIGERSIVEGLSVIGVGAMVPDDAHLTNARLPE
jgi:mannose-1-phosphate guanylyltransferase